MAFQTTPICESTVSLLRAITLGADGACVSLNTWSVLSLVGGFVVAVVVLQWVGRRVIGGRKSIRADAELLDTTFHVGSVPPPPVKRS
ncbi:hypothetical protein N9M66_02010 [Litoreibacter sp.]|nr:hypothetical protein [Litoreibacter sp.]